MSRVTNRHVRHSEALFEDEAFPERELAALVAAKVYYQLQEYDESMGFALGAGKLFDIHHSGEFEETILGESSCANSGPCFLSRRGSAFRVSPDGGPLL